MATPLLASQAWDLGGDEIKDQVQQILLELFQEIRAGKAGMAASVFAGWAKRRSVSLYRKRTARFEGSYERVEPTAEKDPFDTIGDRIPSAEALVLLNSAIAKIPPKHAAAFIRVHIFGMTQKEVAKQMNVSVRTLGEWLKKSAEVLGYDGENYER
jgi:RNA polymerase sigma factor (sigma-70 family)